MRIALPALLVLPALLLPALPAAAQAPSTPPAAVPGVINPQPMVPLIGRRLFSPSGEELGRVVDLVVDADGKTAVVVLDVGGFMGIGMRRVALAWTLLRFRADPDTMRMFVEISAERVTGAPDYRPGDPATILGAP